MSLYLGDFTTANTVYVPFATYDKDDGSSITMTGLAVTDIEIYKDGSTTQRSSDSGITLLDTDGTDFDGITGIHGFSIDLSDNTDAGFYAAGHEYFVVVSAVTVDSVAISFIAATFSIERTGGALALLKNATYGLSAIETLVDDLESRLTETRAGYLDNLSGGAVALASGVNVTQISGDLVAADNLEAQYDGTGIIGSTYPAYQAQVRDIAITGSAVNATAESFTKTYGTENGTYTNTQLANGTYHQIAAENAGSNPYNIDGYYQFDIGVDGVPVELTILGRLYEGSAPYGGDSVDTYAYNWNTTSWDHISPATGDFIGSSSSTDIVKVMSLLTAHVGTGANDGKVRIRLEGNTLEAGTILYIDQILVKYALPNTVSSARAAYLDNIATGDVALASGVNVTAMANDVITAAALSEGAGTELTNAILSGIVEGTHTVKDVMRILLSTAGCKLTVTDNEDGTHTYTWRDTTDGINRVVAVVNDTTYNRTISTLTGDDPA